MAIDRLRATALVLAFVPALLYGTGLAVTLETGTGLGMLLILILLVPLVLVASVAWRQPRWGGDALTALALILALAFLLELHGRYPIRDVAVAGLVMFALPILAGILFRLSARSARRPRSARSAG